MLFGQSVFQSVVDRLKHEKETEEEGAEPPPPDDRITRSAWFARKHDEVAPATWRRASIRSVGSRSARRSGSR